MGRFFCVQFHMHASGVDPLHYLFYVLLSSYLKIYYF
jgi:hypothetical protein